MKSRDIEMIPEWTTLQCIVLKERGREFFTCDTQNRKHCFLYSLKCPEEIDILGIGLLLYDQRENIPFWHI
jgi:hypothetical protein